MRSRFVTPALALLLGACSVQSDVDHLCETVETTLRSPEFTSAPPEIKQNVLAGAIASGLRTSALTELFAVLGDTPRESRAAAIDAFEAAQGVEWNCPAFNQIFVDPIAAPAPPPAAPPTGLDPEVEAGGSPPDSLPDSLPEGSGVPDDSPPEGSGVPSEPHPPE